MTDNLDSRVSAFTREHHGLLNGSYLRSIEASKHEVATRLETHRWELVHEGVYRLAGAPLTWRGGILAACWAGGMRAVASHRSAASLWELPGATEQIAEITCPRWRRARHGGLVVHESKALDAVDCRMVDNIPVTSPELTLLMLGSVCSPLTVEMALDRALLHGLVTRSSVEAILRRLGRRGRNGVAALRDAVDARDPGQAIPESPMETRLLRLLRELGFPPPVPQYEVRYYGKLVGRLDAAYPEQHIGIEFQSYAYHLGRAALDRDNARRRKFKEVRWDVIEVTPEDLRNRGLKLASALHAAFVRSGVSKSA
jgi:hypothetical protein